MHATEIVAPFPVDGCRGRRRTPGVASQRRQRCSASGQAARGFSLLEVLVAFIIVALVVTALFRLFGISGSRRAHSSSLKSNRMIHLRAR